MTEKKMTANDGCERIEVERRKRKSEIVKRDESFN